MRVPRQIAKDGVRLSKVRDNATCDDIPPDLESIKTVFAYSTFPSFIRGRTTFLRLSRIRLLGSSKILDIERGWIENNSTSTAVCSGLKVDQGPENRRS